MNKKIIAVSVLIAILFVSAIAGTIFYYNSVVSSENSKISSLNNDITNLTAEIASLNSQISNLTSQITNLTSANLITSFSVTEEPNNAPLVQMFPTLAVNIPYDNLCINGSVTNSGHVTAFSAGFHVVAYATDGTLEINMTVPLANGIFGTDSATDALILGNPRSTISEGEFAALHLGTIGSLQLGSLDVGQTANFEIAIFHEGVVSNWTITPVWTNTP